MNATDFATLSSTTFSTVVRAEAALRAARIELDAAEAACVCARSCKCSARPAIEAAKLAERAALAATVERRAAWTEYHAIRQGR
jgi:hypothetical protein